MDSWAEGMSDAAWSGVCRSRGAATIAAPFLSSARSFARANLGLNVIVTSRPGTGGSGPGRRSRAAEPEDCIYILDKPSHCGKDQNHFSSNARINGTVQWLDNVNKALGAVATHLAQPVT